VALPAGRDADPVPPREADQPDHVIDRIRLQHSQRTALHDVTEVIRNGPPSGVVDAQRAIEGGKPAPETSGPLPGLAHDRVERSNPTTSVAAAAVCRKNRRRETAHISPDMPAPAAC